MNKLRFSLVPLDALRAVIKVLGLGADKHGDFGWLQRDPAGEVDSLYRHLEAALKGDLDEESGLPAAAHLAARALILTAMRLRGRWPGNAG
jgi:hypothetical protein